MSEYLQLAQPANPDKSYNGWLASEKLDGMLAFWDGGCSIGMPVSSVPWGNSSNKEHRVGGLISTGLWSRYGNPIYYPAGWADSFPKNYPLTGELYLGPGKFQTLMSAVKKYTPSAAEWRDIRFMVLDIPTVSFFLPRTITIRVGSKKTIFDIPDCREFATSRGIEFRSNLWPFHKRLEEIYNITASTVLMSSGNTPLQLVEHHDTSDPTFDLAEFTAKIVAAGGEGSMLKDPDSLWQPKRVNTLVKIKPYTEGVAVVVGHEPGLGKFTGMVGSLICQEMLEPIGSLSKYWFNLSGFTDAERAIGYFPVGTEVQFRYRKRTDIGIPFEARYARR